MEWVPILGALIFLPDWGWLLGMPSDTPTARPRNKAVGPGGRPVSLDREVRQW